MSEEDKNIIRERILDLLDNQEENERVLKSSDIANKLYSMCEYKDAKTILFYASFNGEVDTFEMMSNSLKLKKTIALPCANKNDNTITPKIVESLAELNVGSYGIPEPEMNAKDCPIDDVDLAIVPAVAYDTNNNRLGRGAGYYDRFLDQLPRETPTVGLAFDFQIVDHLPTEEHDKSVYRVLTN